jgi:hypothetical protein
MSCSSLLLLCLCEFGFAAHSAGQMRHPDAFVAGTTAHRVVRPLQTPHATLPPFFSAAHASASSASISATDRVMETTPIGRAAHTAQ